jgi:hypothetical protein
MDGFTANRNALHAVQSLGHNRDLYFYSFFPDAAIACCNSGGSFGQKAGYFGTRANGEVRQQDDRQSGEAVGICRLRSLHFNGKETHAPSRGRCGDCHRARIRAIRWHRRKNQERGARRWLFRFYFPRMRKGRFSGRGTSRSAQGLAEIMLDNAEIGLRSAGPVQAGIDDAAARFDGRKIAEIVGGLERVPGGVNWDVQLRFVE